VAAQLTAPAWARARALGVYHLSFFGALALGSALWGWVGTRAGVPVALALCAGLGAMAAAAVRPWRLDGAAPGTAGARVQGLPAVPLPRPKAPAPALAELLHEDSGRVLEAVHYRVDPATATPSAPPWGRCARCGCARGRLVWRLYEDVARPERWTELWAVESWTEHLREAARLDEADRAALARAAACTAATSRRRLRATSMSIREPRPRVPSRRGDPAARSGCADPRDGPQPQRQPQREARSRPDAAAGGFDEREHGRHGQHRSGGRAVQRAMVGRRSGSRPPRDPAAARGAIGERDEAGVR
jgi:hypothetical protein